MNNIRYLILFNIGLLKMWEQRTNIIVNLKLYDIRRTLVLFILLYFFILYNHVHMVVDHGFIYLMVLIDF
jgi:hypothetical protein